MMHLSRLSEELILWSSFEFGFAKLPEAFCTGSSMMPQKMNPDIPELIRGKTGRVFGNLAGFLATLKALPLAYNKDLQEDKEPLFDTVETTLQSLDLMSQMLAKTEFRVEKMKAATREGFLVATDLADYLVNQGVPFRDSHRIVGEIVRYAQEKGKCLDELDLATLQKFSQLIEKDVQGWLLVENSVQRRLSEGGTALKQVKIQLKKAKKRVAL